MQNNLTCNCYGTGWDGSYSTNTPISIDTNNNGEIEQNEALLITRMNLFSPGSISDLTVLEAFSNLKIFWFNDNSITSFHFPSLVNLISLAFFRNSLLTSVNLNGLVFLSKLDLDASTLLTTIDFSVVPNLRKVTCEDTNISL